MSLPVRLLFSLSLVVLVSIVFWVAWLANAASMRSWVDPSQTNGDAEQRMLLVLFVTINAAAAIALVLFYCALSLDPSLSCP